MVDFTIILSQPLLLCHICVAEGASGPHLSSLIFVHLSALRSRAIPRVSGEHEHDPVRRGRGSADDGQGSGYHGLKHCA